VRLAEVEPLLNAVCTMELLSDTFRRKANATSFSNQKTL
jgi:hypothetical protein